MALDVQQTTRASHPHLDREPTCRPRLLHLTAPSRKHSPSPLHLTPGTQPVEIGATITYLLSRLSRQQQTGGDAAQGKLAPVIEMHGLGHFSRLGRECLPAIAPRKQNTSPSSDSGHNASLTSKSVAGVSRTRLPPRSRFGCWTCRTRKVKCDEARPKCSPCTRLGHRCDYNPRLSFKDDTPRVVEKMQHLTGQAEEELLSRLYDSQLATHRKHDFLPPFSTLTNDEDREKKAEFRPPGNYNVIVTPSSFAGSEEYKANQDGDKTPVTGGSKSSKKSSTDFLCEDLEANVITFKDPDTVMLRVFEDNTKKLSSPSSPSSRFGLSSASSITSPSSGHRFQCMDMFTPPPLTFEIKPQDNRDWPLICHYRNILSRHLFHVHRGSITPALAPGAFFTQELFERTVATFRPLYHALMALCALGIAHRSGIQNLDSLQHYQQALPCLQKTLRSPEDLSSDGALLTHFILLLYEIAAAAPRSSNLWSQHINQLLRIFVLRSEMYETEPYSFLLWWVCNIDTHALVCGTSDGELVDAMLQYNMFPTADNIVQLNGTGECYDPSTEEANAMPAVLSFNRKIEILTCRLGLLRRNLQREAENLARRGIKMSKSDLLERQRRVADIQNALRRTWADQMPPSMVTAIRDNTLPTRAKGIFDNAYVLYRACIIYSHTSMYPTQRHASSLYMIPTTTTLAAHLTSRQYNPSAPLHPANHYNPPINPMEAEISLSAHEILHLTRSIIGSGHHELRFAVFPLFMAGFVLPVQERGLALNLMGGMEMESIGRNTRATRELLEDVFERSDRGEGMGAKGASGVDWIRVLGERGLQLI